MVNNYLLDGIPITDSTNRAVIIPSIEAVQEVKLQINTYDAEVGRTGGGTFNLFLKSGTNDLHGDLFGYTWVQSMLANTYFADAGGRNAAGQLNQPIANQPFYNYGAAIGGPVVIPKLYNGKNKTFFWFSGESYRQTEAATANEAVPTGLERVGNFSRSFAKSGGLQQMYYPDASGRLPFANNIIPQSMINPVGSALASYYPLASQTPAYYGATDYPGHCGHLRSCRPVHQQTRPADQTMVAGQRLLSPLRQSRRERALFRLCQSRHSQPEHARPSCRRHSSQHHHHAISHHRGFLALGLQSLSQPNLPAGQPGNEPRTRRLGSFSPVIAGLVSQLPYDSFPAITTCVQATCRVTDLDRSRSTPTTRTAFPERYRSSWAVTA